MTFDPYELSNWAYFLAYMLFLVVATVIPGSATLYASYTRMRGKGYSPPTAALVLAGGMALGIAGAIYLYPADLDKPNIHEFFIYCFLVPLALIIGLWLVSVRLLPLRETRRFGPRRPGFPYVMVGYILIVIAIIVFGVGFVGLYTTSSVEVIDRLSNATSVVCGFLLLTAFYCFHLDRRKKAPGALAILENDSREPVLYLRAFKQESQFFVIGPKSKYGAYATSLMAQLAEDYQNVGVTFEEYFCDVITKFIGPFVALGSPEDYMPPEGAARVYATDTDWRQRLTALAERAVCILVEVGKSSNLRWEFEQLRRLGLHQKVFVITRPERSSGTRRTRMAYAIWQMLWRLKGIETVTWAQFANDMRAMGYELSTEDPGPGAIVGFDRSAKAFTLATGANWPNEYVEAIRRNLKR